ncbi:uncharacterized protein [Diadema antillarum]|uniref:uncharacterized protein n=1 Tax=Diadema antillarum TaxID=105358 RepID=UPI003A88CB5E
MSRGNPDSAVTPLDFVMEFLEQLKREAVALDSLPESMHTLLDRSCELVRGLRRYPVEMSTGISKAAQLSREKTEKVDYETLFSEGMTGSRKFFKEMASDVLEACTLKMFIRMCSAKKVLEVGCFTGFSALNMAEALPKDGSLVTIEKEEFFARFAREFFDTTDVKDKIEIRNGAAIDELEAAGERGEQYDFIFVDAAKFEYKDYLKIILDNKILAPKGSILFDNTFFKGSTYIDDFWQKKSSPKGRAIHAFNLMVKNDPRIEQVVLPVRDGLTIIRWAGE